MRMPNVVAAPEEPPQTARVTPDVPEPLLPRHSQPGPVTASLAPASAPVREPDEVHIHIGRIEVTAIHEPAPRPREARKGQPPLSLDDYLTKRKGEGR